MILAAPNQYPGSCQPHPNVKPNAFHSMPFFLCCLEGHLVHPSPSTEQATFCTKFSQSKIIPLPSPQIPSTFASTSLRPVVFPSHSRFSSVHGDPSLGQRPFPYTPFDPRTHMSSHCLGCSIQ